MIIFMTHERSCLEEKYVTHKERRERGGGVTQKTGHFILPAMPKGSACSLLGPNFVLDFFPKYYENLLFLLYSLALQSNPTGFIATLNRMQHLYLRGLVNLNFAT